MSLKCSFVSKLLHFKQPAGTSRGVYTTHLSYYVTIERDGIKGVGECSVLPDLSCDAMPWPQYEAILTKACRIVEQTEGIPYEMLRPYPSILFGLETAFAQFDASLTNKEKSQLDASLTNKEKSKFDASLTNKEKRIKKTEPDVTPNSYLLTPNSHLPTPNSHLPTPNSYLLTPNSHLPTPNSYLATPFARGEEGIPINGLVWMGTFEEMYSRLEEKLKAGFHCVKLKIGAIDFDHELQLVKHIREHFSREQIELRVDANGGFTPDNAMERLEALSRYDIHSIEQPIKQHQWKAMARLCRESPLPIALDEELIGVNQPEQKARLLDEIRPAYVVLKPSLHGGMMGCSEWIRLARQRGIGSWITSALESNIGLNAIAHFCAEVYGPDITMPQGLGTGLLYKDNIDMPLVIKGDKLWFLKNS